MWQKVKPKGDEYQLAIANLFGVDNKKPQLGFLRYGAQYKHLSNKDITKFKAEDFLNLLEDFFSGTLEFSHKSEPPIRK